MYITKMKVARQVRDHFPKFACSAYRGNSGQNYGPSLLATRGPRSRVSVRDTTSNHHSHRCLGDTIVDLPEQAGEALEFNDLFIFGEAVQSQTKMLHIYSVQKTQGNILRRNEPRIFSYRHSTICKDIDRESTEDIEKNSFGHQPRRLPWPDVTPHFSGAINHFTPLVVQSWDVLDSTSEKPRFGGWPMQTSLRVPF